MHLANERKNLAKEITRKVTIYVENILIRWHIQRGEWPSGLNSFHQVTEITRGRLRSNSEWVTSEA